MFSVPTVRSASSVTVRAVPILNVSPATWSMPLGCVVLGVHRVLSVQLPLALTFQFALSARATSQATAARNPTIRPQATKALPEPEIRFDDGQCMMLVLSKMVDHK